MIETVDDLVVALGGNSAVADLTGVGAPAVCNWKARGKIPADKFMIFAEALARLDKTAAPALFGFEEARA